MPDCNSPLDLDFVLREDISDADFEIPASIGAAVVDFRNLTAAEAPAAWESLRAWVEWFAVRYRISESIVPVCWWKHGDLVEELSALHAAHTVAFDPSDSGFGPIRWHEQLDLAMPRLRHAYYSQCSRGHNSRTPRTWPNAADQPG
ncbi:hypothetical protein AAIB33_07740 [Microbacterium sp. AZCO]|uniref:hypothetical protein n=1 Tax=Microbacterium sp. AZCO TaxID=3142976 RepID=UPI0031F34D3A